MECKSFFLEMKKGGNVQRREMKWKRSKCEVVGVSKEQEGERLSLDMKERHVIELRTLKPGQGTAFTKPKS